VQLAGQLIAVPPRLLTNTTLTAKTRFVGGSTERRHTGVKFVNGLRPYDDVHPNAQ
jgi:hypothetical protein